MSPSPQELTPPTVPAGQPLDRLLLAEFLRNVPDVVFFKDRECRFVAVSESTARKHGLKVSEMLGRTDFDFFAEAHARPAYDDEQAIMRTGTPILAKQEHEVWSDGRETWALTNKLPLRDEAGAIVGTFGLCQDITEAKRVEAALEKAQQDLLDASRLAGMAEVATEVLHNVGNVLNSLNVSVGVIGQVIQQSRAHKLLKVAELLREHSGALGEYLTQDEKGRLVPGYIEPLARQIVEEYARMQKELDLVQHSVAHINQIVTTQQSYASHGSLVEVLDLAVLVEDALRMKASLLARQEIDVTRAFAAVPKVRVERGKLLQILVNLFSNARKALLQAAPSDRRIEVSIQPGTTGRVRLEVRDHGIGIPAENLLLIFNQGFTTGAHGHGFGLHFCANAAKEMGGSLSARSEGPGTGASFVLELPAAQG